MNRFSRNLDGPQTQATIEQAVRVAAPLLVAGERSSGAIPRLVVGTLGRLRPARAYASRSRTPALDAACRMRPLSCAR